MKRFYGAAVFLVVLVASLLPTHVAKAQCNSRRVIYNQPYYSTYYQQTYTPVNEVIVKEVVTPIAVPVIVPAFSFQYVPPACCQQAGGVMVPGVTPQPIGGYQQVAPVTGQVPVGGGQPIGATNNDSVKALAKAFLEEIKKQDSQPQDDGPPVAVDGSGDVGLPQLRPQPVQQPFTHPGILAMNTNCAKCHTGPQAKGGVRIFDNPGVFNPLAPRDKIIDAVQSRRMPPPTQEALQPADIESIRNWSFGR